MADVDITLKTVDKTSKGMGDADKRMKKFSDEWTKRNKSFQSMEKQKADALKQAEVDKRQALQSTMTKFAGYAAAALAVGKVVQKAFEFAEEGAQVLRLEQSFDDLTESVGANADEMLASLNKAAQGTVSNTDLILSANRAMMLGVTDDAEEMSNLLEIAAFRGRAMGLSTQTAFNDIVTGVGRASPLILDNLGIVTKGKNIYEDYAASLDTTASELTGVEQKQALLNFVLEEGNAQLEQAGGLALDSAGKFEHLKAATKNLSEEMKKGLVDTFDDSAESMANSIDMGIQYRKATKGWSSEMHTAIGEQAKLVHGTDEASDRFLVLASRTEFAAIEQDQLSEQIARTSRETSTLTDTTEDYIVSQEDVLSAGMRMTDMTETYNDKLDDLNTSLEEEQLILEDLAERGWSETSSKMLEQKGIISDIEGEITSMADAMEESTERWILSLLAQGGATVEAQIAYAEFAGLIDEKSANMASAVLEVAGAEDTIGISADEMGAKVADALAIIEEKTPEAIGKFDEMTGSMIPFNEELDEARGLVDHLLTQIQNLDNARSESFVDIFVTRHVTTVSGSGGGFSGDPRGGSVIGGDVEFASGVSDFVVPPGFPNDSFQAGLTSGETVNVETPAQKAQSQREQSDSGGSGNVFDMDEFEGRMANVMSDAVRGFAKQIGVQMQKG